MMVDTKTTLQPQYVRLLLAVSHAFHFDVWTSDVRQAYLQSAEPLTREIIIDKPVNEFDLRNNRCSQQIKPFHGLFWSEDLRHETLDRRHYKHLDKKPCRFDPDMAFSNVKWVVKGA